MADYTNKKIISYAWNEGFLEALLPHEVTHLIFRDFVGIEGDIPLWLDEGVAQWMEPKKRKMVKLAMSSFIRDGKVLSLDHMMRLDIRTQSDKELVNLYYVEAASLVGFLIRKYGSSSFLNFCRHLRDNKSMEDALTFAYPTKIRDLRTLEKKWLKYYGGERNEK